MPPGRLLVLTGLVAVLAVAEGALLVVWWFRDSDLTCEASAVLRGRRQAELLGCFGCHGPDGAEGIPNHGANIAIVPDWIGGTYMMFNQSPDEIREWILDGAPRRLLEDPSYRERRARQLISMPSFRGRVGDEDLEDLVAYVQAVTGAFEPPDGSPAARGRGIAVSNGCFGCHGPEGRGLVRNPGSLKGFIPPWDSDDYPELVKSPEEFREWVAEGEIRRFRDNPAAAFFLDRQIVKMPAYRDILDDAQIEDLRAYVEWIRARPAP